MVIERKLIMHVTRAQTILPHVHAVTQNPHIGPTHTHTHTNNVDRRAFAHLHVHVDRCSYTRTTEHNRMVW